MVALLSPTATRSARKFRNITKCFASDICFAAKTIFKAPGVEQSYTETFRTTSKLLSDVRAPRLQQTDAETMQFFVQGLRQGAKEYVILQLPQTYASAVDAARLKNLFHDCQLLYSQINLHGRLLHLT